MTTEFDPLDPRNLQGRASMLLARAGRMQDLHGQAQATALLHRTAADTTVAPAVPGLQGELNPDQLLVQSASQALADTHRSLQAAALQAGKTALTDPVIARLNAGISGTSLLAGAPRVDVVDVVAVEVLSPPADQTPPERVDTAPPGP